MKKIKIFILNFCLFGNSISFAPSKIMAQIKENKADKELVMQSAAFENINAKEDGTFQVQMTIKLSSGKMNDEQLQKNNGLDELLRKNLPHILSRVKEESIDFLKAQQVLGYTHKIPKASRLCIKVDKQEDRFFNLTPSKVVHDPDSPIPEGYEAQACKDDLGVCYEIFKKK